MTFKHLDSSNTYLQSYKTNTYNPHILMETSNYSIQIYKEN